MSIVRGSLAHPPIERRRAPRRRTLLAGRLSYGDPAMTAPCGVRNLSETGALIELESPVFLMPPYRLLLAREGKVYDAAMMWRYDRRLGVAFERVHDLTQPVDRQVRMLQAIWKEMALR